MTEAEELWAELRQLQRQSLAHQQALDRGLFGWLSTKWLLRFLMAVAAICYVLGFTSDEIWFCGTWGMLMLAFPMWEDESKRQREERMAAYRAEMTEWEATMRRVWRSNRVEDLITPIWMY